MRSPRGGQVSTRYSPSVWTKSTGYSEDSRVAGRKCSFHPVVAPEEYEGSLTIPGLGGRDVKEEGGTFFFGK